MCCILKGKLSVHPRGSQAEVEAKHMPSPLSTEADFQFKFSDRRGAQYRLKEGTSLYRADNMPGTLNYYSLHPLLQQ